MLPFSFIGSGSYVNAASALPTTVPLSDKPDYFLVRDITNWGANGAGSFIAVPEMESWIYPNTMAAGSFSQIGQIVALTSAASLQATAGTTGGFTFIDPSHPPSFAGLVSTTINKTTWVISMASTVGLAVGDWVRITNPVAMLQATGIIGQITALTANTSITLGYVATAVTNGANFTANATASVVTKIFPSLFYPHELQVMHITQAAQAKVYFAKPNDFTPGEIVDFNIPSTYGMNQLSFLTGQAGGAPRVLVVTNTATESSITLNIDTTGFTAFSYPVSAGSTRKASPPFCFPAGSGVVPFMGSATVPASPPGTNLSDAFDNRNQFYMYIGPNVVGANSATMQWTAWKADYSNLSNA